MPAFSQRGQPLVSVVLPTHDRPHRVGAALASVLSQTYTELEILVIDDGSAVAVDDVIAKVARGDPRVHLHRMPVSRGAAAARNSGIRRATGEFIGFIDDDDQWERDKVTRQVQFLDDHPTVGIVSCDSLLIREGHAGTVYLHRPERCTAQLILWINTLGGFSSVIARRALLGDTLQLDESFPSVEDWDLWLRCALQAPVGVVPDPLVRHVSHGDPRLSNVDSNRQGLEAFFEKHRPTMSTACQAFHQAHQDMETGHGWKKRVHVAHALATQSPVASGVLLLEQLTRQLGRVRRDPGLPERTLAKILDRR